MATGSFRRPRLRNTDCVFGTGKGDTRAPGEFDLMVAAHKGQRGKTVSRAGIDDSGEFLHSRLGFPGYFVL